VRDFGKICRLPRTAPTTGPAVTSGTGSDQSPLGKCMSQARCFPGPLKHAGRPSPVRSASPLYAYAVISTGPQELVCPGGLMMRHPSP
jgi:hypothetical protein